MQSTCEPSLVQCMRAHRGEVSCVDVFGARLVSSGGDRALLLWRWEAGAGWQQAAAVARSHRYGVTAARWAASGALVASGGVDGVVRVWCGRSLGARRALAAPGAPAVRALCWAGRRLLVGLDDGALCVWNVARGELVARLHAHDGALHAVTTPRHHALLLTVCTHSVLKVFDLAEVCRSGATGAAVTPLTWLDGAHDLGALCADSSADGRSAATGGHDAAVRVWHADGRSGVAARGALEGHAAAVTALRWGADALLASASLDRTARLWDVEQRACLHVLHAHTRYLTCVALAHDQRFIITGSNDKSVRMWSLGALTLDDELEPACVTLEHFALGDLEGIGPVDAEELLEEDRAAAAAEDAHAGAGEHGDARRQWLEAAAHAGAVNCVTSCGELLATAASDGLVKVWRWRGGALTLLHALPAHHYPATSADFGASGALLLSGGLDGRAALWDVETGVQLRALSVPSEGETGGGGVRGARCSAHSPALLLLATDDGLAPLFSLATAEPTPLHVFVGDGEAATCCAWSRDGLVAATGAASGALSVLAPRPRPAALHHEPHAHDLGVQSCDFASSSSVFDLPDESHLLASAGCDSLIKLWVVDCQRDEDGTTSASVRAVQQLDAHGGGAASVRWGEGGAAALLASAHADRWVRVWRVEAGGAARTLLAVPAPGHSAALAAALLCTPDSGALLAAGTIAGDLALWSLPDDADADSDDDAAVPPSLWDESGVTRWLRDYIVRPPGCHVSASEEEALLRCARDAAVTGARLLADPPGELLRDLGYGEELSETTDDKSELARAATRARIVDELQWLRREPPPLEVEALAPHVLLCALTHRLLREPARAADGFSYERAAILDWFIAAGPEGAVSPASGRRLRCARAPPNYALREQLRTFLDQHRH